MRSNNPSKWRPVFHQCKNVGSPASAKPRTGARLAAVNLLSAEAFVTVVNLGSLHKAAARLGVSSATISRRLTDLESELGVRLDERTTRSLRVTDLGRAFHDQCTRWLDALADAHDLVASTTAPLGG